MPEHFNKPGEWSPEKEKVANVPAMIQEARQIIASTGAADSEFESLANIEQQFYAGKITAQQAQEEVLELLGSRQDYH